MIELFKTNEVFLIPNGAIKIGRTIRPKGKKEATYEVVIGKADKKVKLYRMSNEDVIKLIQFNSVIEDRIVMPWEKVSMNDYPNYNPVTRTL